MQSRKPGLAIGVSQGDPFTHLFYIRWGMELVGIRKFPTQLCGQQGADGSLPRPRDPHEHNNQLSLPSTVVIPTIDFELLRRRYGTVSAPSGTQRLRPPAFAGHARDDPSAQSGLPLSAPRPSPWQRASDVPGAVADLAAATRNPVRTPVPGWAR